MFTFTIGNKVMPEWVEKILWSARYFMLLCVGVALIAGMMVCVASVVELAHVWHIGMDFYTNMTVENKIAFVIGIIELIDMVIFAGILFIFSYGLYELYIDKIDNEEECSAKNSILNITSIDKLKKKLGHLILMLFIIKLFSYFVKIDITTPLDFLIMAASVTLVAIALYLTNKTTNTTI